MKKWFVVSLLLAAFAMPGWSEAKEQQVTVLEEVVVTATRLETPTKEVGSSSTIITSEEIEQKQQTSVLEVLRSVPALDVVQTGGPGRTTSVFIRGAKSEHTLVLLDGVEMNDPSSTGRSFDFASLSTENIERIEIIRGPQSTLYGSDAIGGVINIITKKGKGKPSGFVSAEAGSFNTFIEKAGVSGAGKLIHYSLGVSRWDTDGISAASEEDGNEEEDGYENTSFSARLGIDPTDTFDVDCILRYNNSETDMDNSGGVGGDDPNYTQESEQLFFRTQGRVYLFNGFWEQKLGVSLSDHDRGTSNDTDDDHPFDLVEDSYKGQIIKFDWQHNLYLHETHILTLGVETEKEKMESDYYSESSFGSYTSTFDEETARTNGFYLQDKLTVGDVWFTTLGVRVDDHENFGTETTYRFTSTYLIRETDTRLKGSYGTGFKAPSLYQLYSQYGSEDLEPEESIGWDIGVEQWLCNNTVTLGATYFSNDFDDLIDFDSATWTYFNVAEAESDGIELFAQIQPINGVSARANYTYTDTKDKNTGEKLLRRAQSKLGIDVNYRFLEKGNVNVGLVYVGARDDQDYSTFPATRVELDSYLLVNLAASYQLIKNIKIFGRIENLFDEDYEEVLGYGTPGLSAFAGAKLTF